ncbi:MAG: hypothetical protein HKN08_09685 [Gammaproteobacteria bacterium]|nr:hypothetical protein [Gammaproteobacteria bacterium]
MYSQRVNRFNSQSGRTAPAILRRSQIINDKPICDNKTGFIRHPSGFPLEIKRRRFWERHDITETENPKIGIIFESMEYIKPGEIIDIIIPLQNKLETFTGRVILVKNVGEAFEIGLWLLHEEDASRARIVEQLCHIELYMQEKKYREGPYNLNPDRVASEWITKYASEVPSL